MSAVRKSGNVTVRLTYRDASGVYKCSVRTPDGRRMIYVGEPKCLEHAVDSPEAFDNAARGATVFASDEGLDCQPDWSDDNDITSIVWSRR